MLAKFASIILLGLILGGCALGPARAKSGPPTTVVVSPSPLLSVASSTPVPSPVPTATVLSATTVPSVTIAAVKGNLFIRRGPDTAFNPISALMAGQSAKALARDVLGTWVKIALPDNPKTFGWVSIQTQYSAVTGDIMSLPEIFPTDWPVVASLRNCTFHEMITDPGGIVLPSLANFPANDVPVDPGIYRIRDTEVDGYPEVAKVELREGLTIDIRDNGDGEHHKCP